MQIKNQTQVSGSAVVDAEWGSPRLREDAFVLLLLMV
jgi:hypothetical protein